MREISRRAGRGKISPSTVHNLFRSSRVPRWEFLEQVVLALGGAGDREEFLDLWQAAWRAENEVETLRAGPANATPARAEAGTSIRDSRRTRSRAGTGTGQRPRRGSHSGSGRTKSLPAMSISPDECPNWS